MLYRKFNSIIEPSPDFSNTIKNTKQTVVRETRRTNQDYAAKAIASTVNYCKNTLTNSAWDASFKFAVGTGVSNGISVKYSSYSFFANVPSLKLW